MPTRPDVVCERQHPGLYVSDVAAAVDFYVNKLGFQPGFVWGEPPTIAGVNLGQVQVFLERGSPAPQGCSVYFVVDDADALCEFQRQNGVEVTVDPGDRVYGIRDYSVRDLHGYRLTFGHLLLN